MLFRTKPCEEGMIRKGNTCVALDKRKLQDCKDPDLSTIRKGIKLTLCDGSISEGSLIDCSKDGEQDCIASGNFKVADSSNLMPSDIKFGKIIASILGSKRDVKQCRNAANLSHYDGTPLSDSTKKIPTRIFMSVGGNTVQLNWNHGLVNNDPVQLTCPYTTSNMLPGGAVFTGIPYYANVMTANRIQFQAAPSGGALTVTSTTGCSSLYWLVGTHANSVSENEDTIDDYNGYSSVPVTPSSSPWSSEYVCDQINFKNISGAAPYTPSNSIPLYANQAWTQIWRDELTGKLFTNVLYDGVSNDKDWFQKNAICKNLDTLNSGAGGSGWRLPTQKELMQLYINGASKALVSGFPQVTNSYFISSTGLSTSIRYVWAVNLLLGTTYSGLGRDTTNYSVICMR